MFVRLNVKLYTLPCAVVNAMYISDSKLNQSISFKSTIQSDFTLSSIFYIPSTVRSIDFMFSAYPVIMITCNSWLDTCVSIISTELLVLENKCRHV